MSLLALLATSAHRPLDSVAELLAQIRDKGDEVETAKFLKIAEIGGLEAYEALVTATDLVEGPTALYAAYGAFTEFSTDTKLATTTLEFLNSEAFKDRRDMAQLAATWALSTFEPTPLVALEKILRKHKNSACRGFAIVPLLPLLGERGDTDSAELILEYTTLRTDGEQEATLAALKLCKEPRARKLMIEKLGERRTPPEWKRILLNVLIEDQSAKVTKALLKIFKEDNLDDHLQRALIETLGTRRVTRAVKPLKATLNKDDDEVRYAAVVAITRIVGQDRVWMAKLRAFSQGDDATMRLAAVQALTELRASDSVSLLEEFMADPDSRVRSQAVELLASTRSRESIPIFIERLDQEHGPVGLRIARVLRLITGKDFGFKSGRWRAWWKAEGASFVLPSRAEALQFEFARRKAKDVKGRTQSTFYGLPVLSQNVCFILDTSGSMSTRVPGKVKTSTTAEEDAKGPMRITIAKKELSNVLGSLSLETFANLVFFSKDAFAWRDELFLLEEEVRKDAIDFVERIEAKGGTNVYGGLALAFADPRIDTIYILTDGSPSAGLITDPEQLLEEVEGWNQTRRIQINCISVGRESDFLRQLAAQNGGDYRVAM